jgi:hypothetical protein
MNQIRITNCNSYRIPKPQPSNPREHINITATVKYISDKLATVDRGKRLGQPENLIKINSLGDTIFILKPEKPVNPIESMRLLAENGQKPLDYKYALYQLTNNALLMRILEGERFWLEDKGTDKHGTYSISKDGDLVDVGFKGINPDRTIRVWKGGNYLALDVYDRIYDSRRLGLTGCGNPEICEPATVIVGIKTRDNTSIVCQKTNAGLNSTLRK